MIDVHVHILPDLDDGASDMEISIQMARMAAEDGIRTLVATPHVMRGAFDNNKEDILREVAVLNDLLVQEGIPLKVLPGAEYYLEPDLSGQLIQGELLPLGGSGRYLLVELPSALVPDYTVQVLYELQLAGVVPVIAHPERNSGFLRDPELLTDLVGRGCLAQVTAASVIGLFGRGIKKAALDFIRRGLVQVLATDAHSIRGRAPVLGAAAAEVKRVCGEDMAQALVKDNPQRILDGLALEPMTIMSKRSWWQRMLG
jgi:protein-tyrosine phosphatase